jgi:hypothetical protein
MVSRVIGKETTCVLQLLARLPISMSSDGIGSSNDMKTHDEIDLRFELVQRRSHGLGTIHVEIMA